METKVTTKKGGKRKGAGRAKLLKADKKQAFYIYISQNAIKRMGGRLIVKRYLENLVSNPPKYLLKN